MSKSILLSVESSIGRNIAFEDYMQYDVNGMNRVEDALQLTSIIAKYGETRITSLSDVHACTGIDLSRQNLVKIRIIDSNITNTTACYTVEILYRN